MPQHPLALNGGQFRPTLLVGHAMGKDFRNRLEVPIRIGAAMGLRGYLGPADPWTVPVMEGPAAKPVPHERRHCRATARAEALRAAQSSVGFWARLWKH